MNAILDGGRRERIASDFDAIARLSTGRWDQNAHYHGFLLRQIPAFSEAIFDVGCGAGAFTRLLAPRARSVVGIDLSGEMIGRARERCADLAHLRFIVGDVMEIEQPCAQLGAITAVASLHHLPFEPALCRLAEWLEPGGRLIVLDLFHSGYGRDLLWKIPAGALSATLSLLHNRRLRAPRAAREAWQRHAQRDRFLTLDELRRRAGSVLPGVVVRRHLLWRYSLVWEKPRADAQPATLALEPR